MDKINLVIVGSGSTYTIGMIMSLIEEKDVFPIRKLVFYDIDEERQALIAKGTEIILKEKYPELEEFIYTTDKKVAYSDMDFAFIQIRTGGLKMRVNDEQIPLKYNCVGQETCGAGGMAYGLRSIKDMIEIIKDIREYSKDAWILNYTNPAAIVAEALKREFPEDKRILNICDMPIAIMISYADILGLDVWDIVPEYFGLNHFGWFTKIYDKQGNDHTELLKKKIIEEGFAPKDSEIAEDKSWIKTFDQARQMLIDYPEYLPNTYLQYYLYPNKMVKKEDINNVRAIQVINGREKRVKNLCEKIIADNSSKNCELSSDIHGRYMVRAAASLAYNMGDVYIVMVKNDGVIANLPEEAMIEVPARLSKNGIRPFALGKIPTFYKGLIEGQLAYEMLVVDSYYEKDYKKLLQALALNRTVVDTEVAKKIIEDMVLANGDYWPELN